MRRNIFPALMVGIVLILAVVAGVFGYKYLSQISDEKSTAVEESSEPAEKDMSTEPVGNAAIEATGSAIEGPDGDPTNNPKYTEYHAGATTIRPEKWNINAFGEIQDQFFTYNNSNKVNFGAPTSWQCYITNSVDAEWQSAHYVNEEDDGVMSHYNMSVSLYGSTRDAHVYEFVDSIMIIAPLQEDTMVIVECNTTDIEVAKKSFKEAMDVTIIRK